MAVLCCGMPQSKAAGRATEILEKLAAGFRAMPGYSVDFEVSAGDYKSRGNYVVEGRCYYLALADAEVFADSVVRYEIDNRRREVTVTEVDAASRNILNNPVRAFDFLGSEYIPALVSEAGVAELLFDLGQCRGQRILFGFCAGFLGGRGNVVVLIFCHSVLLLYPHCPQKRAVLYFLS